MLSANKAREIAKTETPVEEAGNQNMSNAMREDDSYVILISDGNIYEKICKGLEETGYKIDKTSSRKIVVIGYN